MRYTRFEFKNINSINRKRAATKFLLISPIVIALGFLISRIFILPHILKTDTPVEKVKYAYQNMKSRSYYSIQMGVFASSDNVKAYTSMLRNNNIPAYVDANNKYSFVFSYTGGDRNIAEGKAQYYRKNGYVCLVKRIDIIPDNLPNYVNDDRYILLSRLVNESGSFMDCCSSSFNSFEQKQIDYDGLIKNLKELYIRAHECLNEYVNLKDGQVSEEEYDEWIALYNIMDEIINFNNDSGLYVKFNEKLMQAIYSYYDIVEKIKL